MWAVIGSLDNRRFKWKFGMYAKISRAAAVSILSLVAGAAQASPRLERAVLAGGCFWGVEGVFEHVKGVREVVAGYAGGSARDANYSAVSSERTKHAEAVRITYDPKQISYAQLLKVYATVAHDPTQLNRQGPDVGHHYRSAIFHADEVQKQVAQKYIAQLDGAKAYPRKIVTEVTPQQGFYPAEAYHQDYATLHPESGSIAAFDLPKIANLKTMFPGRYLDKPQLVGAKSARLDRK